MCFGIVEGIELYGVIDMNNVVASFPIVFVAKKASGEYITVILPNWTLIFHNCFYNLKFAKWLYNNYNKPLVTFN